MRATSSGSAKRQSQGRSRPPGLGSRLLGRRRAADACGVSRARDAVVIAVPAAALVFLIALGALGAWAGGAPIVRPALRVGFWGALAMAVTAGIGALVGKAI